MSDEFNPVGGVDAGPAVGIVTDSGCDSEATLERGGPVEGGPVEGPAVGVVTDSG
jgi:hypothetical protein